MPNCIDLLKIRLKELATTAMQSFRNFAGKVPDFEFFNPETALIILVSEI